MRPQSMKMEALRALRRLATISAKPHITPLNPTIFHRLYAAQPLEDDLSHSPTLSDGDNGSDLVFDSSRYTLPSISSDAKAQTPQQPAWDKRYREKADELIFGKDAHKAKLKALEEDEEKRRRVLAKALLEAALERADDEDENEDLMVKQEDQKSLSVGIIGAPNAGKSALTNYMVRRSLA